MKIFLSHALKDSVLAGQLAQRLRRQGFDVWVHGEQITPGENWAKKTGKALDDSDLMVLLFTPTALQSDQLRHDIEFAISSLKFENRVFTVFVGPQSQADRHVPWILQTLPFRQVESKSGFGSVVKAIRGLSAEAGVGALNA